MRRVVLPSGRLELTELGLGTAPIAGLFAPVSEQDAVSTFEAAWDAGIRMFDTAPHYGAGLSEIRVGAWLSGKPRDEFVLSTKVGRLLVPAEDPVDGSESFFSARPYDRVFDYSGEGIRRSISESLERLGLDRIDIALIHDPDDHFRQAMDEAHPALVELRDEGVVGAIGLGMNQTAMLERFVNETDIDCVLIAGRYSLLDRSAAHSLLPACAARGVGVLIGGVFNSGILVDPRPGATFDYEAAPPRLLDQALALQAICARHETTLAAAALQWPLRHPAVTTVLVGARRGDEVDQDAAWFKTPVPEACFEELEAWTGS